MILIMAKIDQYHTPYLKHSFLITFAK